MKKLKSIWILTIAVLLILSVSCSNDSNNNENDQNQNINVEENEQNNNVSDNDQNLNLENNQTEVTESEENGEGANDSTKNTSNQTQQEIVLPEFELENNEVKFLYTNGPDENHEFMLEKFKEYTKQDIKILYDVVTWNEYQTKLSIMVMGDQAPDMYKIERVVTPYLIREELFEPIEELIDFEDPLWKDLKPYTGYSTYKNNIYSIPDGRPSCIQIVIFNNKFFEDYGLENPRELFYKDEWTWDKFLEYAQMFTEDSDGDGETDVYGISMGDYASMFFAVSTGQDIVKFHPDGTIENNLRDPNFERSFELYNNLGKAGAIDPVQWEHIKSFPQNKIAMRIDHNWIIVNEPYKTMLKNNEISFAPLPRDPESDVYYHVGTVFDQFVPKGAANAEGAIAWYTFNRYLQLVEDEEVVAKNMDLWKNEWGWSDEDIEMTNQIMKYELEPIIVAGDRMPGFSKQTDLWNLPAQEPWSKVVEEINPNLQEAIDKLNQDLD